jgi:signal transduction histidine kinase
VQQALLNLVMNAAQAMPQGGPVLIRTGHRGAEYAWISVSDEGVGIAEEDLDRIFEPFFTTKPKGEGTGLGLSLTKKLIEANRGKIEVESVKGRGSTFRLLLPVSN